MLIGGQNQLNQGLKNVIHPPLPFFPAVNQSEWYYRPQAPPGDVRAKNAPSAGALEILVSHAFCYGRPAGNGIIYKQEAHSLPSTNHREPQGTLPYVSAPRLWGMRYGPSLRSIATGLRSLRRYGIITDLRRGVRFACMSVTVHTGKALMSAQDVLSPGKAQRCMSGKSPSQTIRASARHFTQPG